MVVDGAFMQISRSLGLGKYSVKRQSQDLLLKYDLCETLNNLTQDSADTEFTIIQVWKAPTFPIKSIWLCILTDDTF